MNFLMVTMASGIARGRVRTTTTTTESRKMAAILQVIGWQRHAALVYRLLLWYWTSMLRSMTRVKTRYLFFYLYPYFLFAAIHHLKSSPTFSVRPCSSVGRVTVDLFRRSWVRFPPRSKDFFFASCGALFPFTRANAQWVIHGFKVAL